MAAHDLIFWGNELNKVTVDSSEKICNQTFLSNFLMNIVHIMIYSKYTF